MDNQKNSNLAPVVIIVVVVLLAAWFGRQYLVPRQLQGGDFPIAIKEYRKGDPLTAILSMQNTTDTNVVVWESAKVRTQSDGNSESVTIERIQIAPGESASIEVPAPENGAWQVELSVARFEKSEQQRFEAGKELKGTVAISEFFPKSE